MEKGTVNHNLLHADPLSLYNKQREAPTIEPNNNTLAIKPRHRKLAQQGLLRYRKRSRLIGEQIGLLADEI